MPLLIEADVHDAPVAKRPQEARADRELDSISATVVVGRQRRYLLAGFDYLASSKRTASHIPKISSQKART
jgi:hypothetical protein